MNPLNSENYVRICGICGHNYISHSEFFEYDRDDHLLLSSIDIPCPSCGKKNCDRILSNSQYDDWKMEIRNKKIGEILNNG